MAHPATHQIPLTKRPDDDPLAPAKLAIYLLGVFVLLLMVVVVLMWRDAHQTRAAAPASATTSSDTNMPGMAAPSVGAYPTPSYAGLAPANADTLAEQHVPVAAELPPLTPGAVVNVKLDMLHKVVQVAPGISYDAWTFNGAAPGPVVHARQGQIVHVTIKNDAPMPHSVDFHAALVAPNVDFVDVMPGKTYSFSFKAEKPGVYMYHCGTKPVLAHIANGMYGAIVVDPANASLLPKVEHSYVLVASEWYLNAPGLNGKAASLDMAKAHQLTPDWLTFNGYAGQYVKHPLTAMPGDTTRFYVVDAGPSINTTFHVVGTVLQRAWVDSDVQDSPERDVQTVLVPAGGGAIFDVTIAKAGLYPFVSHAFASVDMGQVGVLKVGHVEGTMSH